MKKLSFKNFSVLGLVLMGVSALTAAMIPSKGEANNQAKADAAAAGVSFISSGGAESTVRAGAGLRSYTATGNPADNFDLASATSVVNDDNGTVTQELGNQTGQGTSVV